MSSELVPELHDIGKLTNLWETRGRHNLEDFDFAAARIRPISPTWQGILEHHCTSEPDGARGYKRYPTSGDTFLCCLADSLASAVSRGKMPQTEEDGEWRSDVLQKPWAGPSTPSRHFPFIDPVRAACFVEEAPSAEDYISRYGDLLQQRAEDTRYPVTSLYTHSILSGKFYRLLKASFEIPISELGSLSRAEVAAALSRKRHQWRLTVAGVKPKLLLKPFRARDMGVFLMLGEAISQLGRDLPDSLVFSSQDMLLIVTARSEDLQEMCELFHRCGFWLEITKASRTLEELMTLNLMNSLGAGAKKTSEFPELPEEIRPPICELCQMAPAQMRWGRDSAHDELCLTCFSVRESGATLTRLASWENELVAWVRVGLDFDRLIGHALPQLIAARFGIPTEQADVRFTLVAEFQRDYDALLGDIESQMVSHFGSDRVERVLPGLWCLSLEKVQTVTKVLGLVSGQIRRWFPKFFELERSPIFVGISCSGAKFPFFEHWRVLGKPSSDVLVNLVGRGRLRAPLRAMPHVVTLGEVPNKRPLYRLAEVAKVSSSLAKAMMHDRSQSDTVAYRQMLHTLHPLGLDYESLLTLARIVGGSP